ncbi:MAG: hypothetical protein FWF90_10955 [Promicromonosporaceae bacterium]|nr:hypothetical protein [Promicromonosporaceae bacterium]
MFEEGGGVVSTYSTSLAISAWSGLDAAEHAPAMARAAGWLRRQQASEEHGGYDPALHPGAYGGFAYGAGGGARGSRPDLSNTWMALQALRDSGLAGPDDPVWARALVFAQRCQHTTETNDQPWATDNPDPLGGGVYLPDAGADGAPAPYGTMTCALILAYLSAGVEPGDERLALAVGWLARNFDVEGVPRQGQDGLYYYYRILAKALSALGEPDLGGHAWAPSLARAVAARQRPDGSFANAAAGRWQEGDPALATGYALAALGLARQAMASGAATAENIPKPAGPQR